MGEIRREQFTFYRSFYEAILDLPKRDQIAAMMAICAYALDGDERPLSGAASAVFKLIRPVLDSAAKKAESGKKGGEVGKIEKQTASKRKAKRNHPASEGEKEKEVENEMELEIEGEVDIENEIEKENDRDRPPLPPSCDPADTERAAMLAKAADDLEQAKERWGHRERMPVDQEQGRTQLEQQREEILRRLQQRGGKSGGKV